MNQVSDNFGLKPARVLRQEQTNQTSEEIINLKKAIADGINAANGRYTSSMSLEGCMKGTTSGMKQAINQWLTNDGYTVTEYSDFRDSYYNVSW